MSFYIWLLFNSVLLGVGLAMDAFSVSLANGFAENTMTRKRKLYISGIYAIFQFIMPFTGWILVHFAVSFFKGFQKFIPFIALILLAFIGGKMVVEGFQSRKCSNNGDCASCSNGQCDIKDVAQRGSLTFKVLILQGIATSIDALSVGFTIAEYNVYMVILSALIIGVVTHIICYIGLEIGTRFGTKLAGNARIIGGLILIGIGIEICIKGLIK